MQPIIETTISSCSSPARQGKEWNWGVGGRERGARANMSALQSCSKKIEQRSHPECERGWRLQGTQTLSAFHPILIIREVESGEEMSTAKV